MLLRATIRSSFRLAQKICQAKIVTPDISGGIRKKKTPLTNCSVTLNGYRLIKTLDLLRKSGQPSARSGASPRQPFSPGSKEPELLSPLPGERARVRVKSVLHRSIQQRQINNFEKYLVNNGVIVLKFFLNTSKAEQKKCFLERINKPEKNWKFSASDAKERTFWNDYMNAYENVFNRTSTKWARWHTTPADYK